MNIKNKILKRIIIFVVLGAVVAIFTYNDAFIYSTPVAKVTSVTEQKDETKTGFDGNHEYKEKYYTQTLKGKILNGKDKGKEVTMENSYTSSQVYDMKYSKGDRLFIERVEKDGDYLTAVVKGAKRDYFVILSLVIMLALFLIIGGREGVLTIVSLAANLVFFYFVIVLYFKGVNILALCIPMSVIFTAMLLFFMYGNSRRTWLSLAATVLSVLITTAVTAIVMVFSGRIDYDFMEFLIQPYDQMDANMIFLSEVLICSMGAIMDVVVTMIITLDEIHENNGQISRQEIMKASRNVGDEVVGTMISIMFFTNLASGIPFVLLSMRNGVAIHTILRYNSFFAIARFLTGSIGIVLAIPVAAVVAIIYYRKAGEKQCS